MKWHCKNSTSSKGASTPRDMLSEASQLTDGLEADIDAIQSRFDDGPIERVSDADVI